MKKLMILVMLFLTVITACGYADSEPSDVLYVGDIVTFGCYEQDGQRDNGPEPIQWIVIKVDNSKSLLLSKYTLDNHPYNDERAEVTWETCSLRKWLNDEFLNTAFDVDERAFIQDVTNTTENSFGTGHMLRGIGGNATDDKVFVLSAEEVYSLRYDFTDLSFVSAMPTKYAVSQGAYTDFHGYGWWWLRTPGATQQCTAIVKYDDYGKIKIDDTGVRADALGTSVRPAVWISNEYWFAIQGE